MYVYFYTVVVQYICTVQGVQFSFPKSVTLNYLRIKILLKNVTASKKKVFIIWLK